MKRIAVVMLLALAALSCEERPASLTVSEPLEASKVDRLTITRLGDFDDDLAYGDRRVVYLIVDRQTGTEFIGISGVGISEVGVHTVTVGKATVAVEDER